MIQLVAVAHGTGLAGGDVGPTFGLGVAQAQSECPDSVRASTSSWSSGEPNCCDGPRDHGRGPPVEPRRVRATDLQVPDALTYPAEATVGLGLEVGGQIAGLAERQVHTLVEVLAGLPVARNDLVGHDLSQERPQFVLERLILVGQRHSGKVHPT